MKWRFGINQPVVRAHHLGDLLLDRVQWVQSRHGLLEDHADLIAADPPHELLMLAGLALREKSVEPRQSADQ